MGACAKPKDFKKKSLFAPYMRSSDTDIDWTIDNWRVGQLDNVIDLRMYGYGCRGKLKSTKELEGQVRYYLGNFLVM